MIPSKHLPSFPTFGGVAPFRFSPLALSLSLALLTGCSTVRPPLVPLEKGGPGWTEVGTEHFVLKTDLDSTAATRAAGKLEEMFAALAELGFASEDRPKMSIDVIFFERHEDYAEVRPQATAGQFSYDGMHDFERRPTAVLGGEFVERTRSVLLHELTHLFVHYYYPQAPIWLNEGLAQYFETLTIDDGTAILGRAPEARRFWKGPWQVRPDPKGWRALIPVGDAPTAKALRAMRADFYGDLSVDPTTVRGAEASRPMHVHYQAAWCLVHLLFSDPAYSQAFGDYLGRLRSGTREPEAWGATVGALGDEKLEASYRAALVPLEVTTLRSKLAVPQTSAPRIGAMTASDVHVLWARLRDWSTPQGRAAADADLGAAAEDDVEAVVARAELASSEAHAAEAERFVRLGLARAPTDRRLWNALGWIVLRGGVGDPAKKLGEVAKSLAGTAVTAAELDLAARSASLVDSGVDDALALEKRALGVDPNCVACLAESAELLAKKGRLREAVDVAALALTLAPESRPSRELAASIEGWKRTLAEAKEVEPSSAPVPPPVPHAEAVLSAMRGRFHPCFDDASRGPGEVEFELRVDAGGSVTSVAARPGASFAPDVVECLAGVLKAGHFPAPGADTTLTVPIRTGAH